MPRFDFECPECGIFELTLPMGVYTQESCPTCGSPLRKLVATGVGFECARVTSERAPRYSKWLETEGARRMRLPDDHPDKLEPVSKASDLAHGVPDAPPDRPTVDQTAKDFVKYREEFAAKRQADSKITVSNSAA